MDRELRFQHNGHGTPHRFCTLPANNLKMRSQAGIAASDRPQRQIVDPFQTCNLRHRSTCGPVAEPVRQVLQKSMLAVAQQNPSVRRYPQADGHSGERIDPLPIGCHDKEHTNNDAD